MMWLPLTLLIPLQLVLVRLKQRGYGPVAAWPWWLVWLPCWLPVGLFIGFGLAMLAFAVFVLFLDGRPL